MKNFAVVQHTYSEFLGLIEAQLEKREIGFDYFRPFVEQPLPPSAAQYDALFLLGGAFPVADRGASPWVEDELRLVSAFHKAQRPVVGFGFGAHVIAESVGARLTPEPSHRAYWTRARMTGAGAGDRLAQAVDGQYVPVLYNGNAVLPSGLEPILVDEQGEWIAARPDPLTYAMLFRPELKPGMIEDIMMEANRDTPENLGEFLAEARERWGMMQQVTDRVIVALVAELDLMRERHKSPVFRLQVSE